MLGIAPAMETGDHDNPKPLNLEEDSVRKAAHSGTTTSPVDDWKLQWVFCYCIDGGLYRKRETFA